MPLARPRHFSQRPDRSPLSWAGCGEMVRDAYSDFLIPKRFAVYDPRAGGWVSTARADGSLDRYPDESSV